MVKLSLHLNPNLCGVLVQKCHLGFWMRISFALRKAYWDKIDFASLFSWSEMKRSVCLKVFFLNSFNVFPQKPCRGP